MAVGRKERNIQTRGPRMLDILEVLGRLEVLVILVILEALDILEILETVFMGKIILNLISVF